MQAEISLQHITTGRVPVVMYAVRRRSTALVDLLHSYGAKLDEADSNGSTSLHEAVALNAIEVAERLLDLGADINARVTHGGSVLYNACFLGRTEMVRMLLARGADIHIATHEGNWSPFEVAFDFSSVVELLVNHKEKPDFHRAATSTSYLSGPVTALYLAVQGRHTESVRLMLGARDDDENKGLAINYMLPPDCGDLSGYTCLAVAAANGDEQVVRMLLERGASVNHRIPTGGSILTAVTDEKTLKTLLEYNPDLELKDDEDQTVLNFHVNRQELLVTIPFLRRLVNAGADLETQDSACDTPLASAAAYGNLDALDFLVERGADIDKKVKYGRVVHRAVVNGRLSSLKRLVDAGADASKADYIEGTPMQRACGRNDEMEWLKFLVYNAEGGRDRNTIIDACRRCGLDALEFLLGEHGSPTYPDRVGLPPLMAACLRSDGAPDVVKMLEQRGADISPEATSDHLGRTMIHAAVLSADIAVVQYVMDGLKQSADAPGTDSSPWATTDKSGWTALHWAVRPACLFTASTSSETDEAPADRRATVVRFLLEQKCPGLLNSPPVEVDGTQWTVLSLAKYHGAPQEVIDAIVKSMREDFEPPLDVESDPGN